MSDESTAGRLLAKARSVAELLEFEHEYGRPEYFAELDSLVGEVFVRSMRGERLLTSIGQDDTGAPGRSATLRLKGTTESQRKLLDELFSLENQQARGMWLASDEVGIRIQLTQFAANLREYGRFAHTVTLDEYEKVGFANSPEALFTWVILEPLFKEIYKPFGLRGEQVGKKTPEERLAEWQHVDEFFDTLDFSVEEQLATMRYGNGWSKLRAHQQLAAKRSLMKKLSEHAKETMAARYRAYRTLPILHRYYEKAEADGRALRSRVLTRKLEGTLSGFFGGDWLAFLAYLGEKPHPEEEITTALPKTKLYIDLPTATAEVAAREGVDEEQLRLIMSSLYEGSGTSSPVLRRTNLLVRYWERFDELHAEQSNDMPSLEGLVEDYRQIYVIKEDTAPYQYGMYRRLLPLDLLAEIEEYWGSKMLSRWPNRIVTEPFPHASMAETFGPALEFWHRCTLLAWFSREGGLSYVDDLEDYYHREIAELEDLGTPIDKTMLEELVAAGGRLKPGQEYFEKLRDLITGYRRAWAEQYLRSYLRTRAEGEIRGAVKEYYRRMYRRGGKPPTVKQFASSAEQATNHWFGGDIASLYRAFGERSPVTSKRVRLMPSKPESFVKCIYATLGGTQERWSILSEDPREAEAQEQRIEANYKRQDLANLALKYIQLQEALGHKPDLKTLGKSKFERHAEAIVTNGLDEAWRVYTDSIERCLRSCGSEEVDTN